MHILDSISRRYCEEHFTNFFPANSFEFEKYANSKPPFQRFMCYTDFLGMSQEEMKSTFLSNIFLKPKHLHLKEKKPIGKWLVMKCSETKHFMSSPIEPTSKWKYPARRRLDTLPFHSLFNHASLDEKLVEDEVFNLFINIFNLWIRSSQKMLWLKETVCNCCI